MTGIGESAFLGCAGLTSVVIPASVTAIHEGAFYRCDNLTVYYSGTSEAWNAIRKGERAIPEGTVIRFRDEDARVITVTLNDKGERDRVRLTDGLGIVAEVTQSGTYRLWPMDAKLEILPETGRRFSGNCITTVSSGGTVQTDEIAYFSGTEPYTRPLDLSRSGASVTVSFSPVEAEYFLLSVIENGRDEDEPEVEDSWWTLTDAYGQSYQNGSKLIKKESVMSEKHFTLTLTPDKGWGCVGSIAIGDSVITDIMAGVDSYQIICKPNVPLNLNVTLNLNWYSRSDLRTVAYLPNGGQGSTTTQLAEDGEDVTVSENRFTRSKQASETQPVEYWMFTGWNTKAEGDDGTEYQPGDVIEGISADVTLYARWTEAWRLGFDENGGKGRMPAFLTPKSNLNPSPSFDVPECGYTREGFAFTGWSTKKNGGVGYQPGDVIEDVNANMTLYAQWTEAYTVTFDPNGAAGESYTRTVAQGGAMTLPGEPGFLAPAKTFAGWNTQADGSGTACAAGGPFTPQKDCTLYAQWDWNPFAVECVDCSAQVGGAAVTEALPGTQLTLVPAVPEGMLFKEWAVTPENAAVIGETLIMPVGDVTVRAVFEGEGAYLVTVAAIPEEGGTVSGKGTYAGGAEVTITADPRPGFRFVNWKDGETVASTDAEYTFAAEANCDLTAIFEKLPPFDAEHVNFTIPAARIETGAFAGDSGIAVVDASHCAYIGENAFSGCMGLTQILLPADCEIAETAFDGCASLIAIYAPRGGTTRLRAEELKIPLMPVGEE